jgi:hypothetical protein
LDFKEKEEGRQTKYNFAAATAQTTSKIIRAKLNVRG